MSKKQNQVYDKKTLDKYRKDFIDDFNKNYRDDLVKDLANDVKDSFTEDYKDNLKNELTEEVKDDVKSRIAQEEKKLGRAKSFKIFRFSIYIILLLVVIGYVFYRLYKTDNIDIINYNYKVSTTTQVIPIITSETTTTTQVKDLNYYISTYGYLLNNLHVTDYELLKGNTNISDVSMSDKLAMAYKSLNQSDIVRDGEIITVYESSLRNAYIALFGTNDYSATSFTVDNNNFVYSARNGYYMAISNNESNEYVVNQITNVSEDNNNIIIEALTGVVINNNLYSVNDLNNILGTYTSDINLSNYANSLTKVKYTFTNNNGNYYITNISNE